ncbi:sensor domain-containing diguanylate cyclase [Pseudoduganella namucuonensis]|uniref:diguanylate cyclase n=1 Tax=Pseudoduganella namucuonensis TaxID=1035707 RepID=A0A1I7KBA7_9BURK|nr:sensor domain-containing diguanylate cyclase [Pseudoduganella namucuonensis]SFU94706.1 diguanylate cyclase (GGDEF) domain-containing protein [Pseudoduganella namucuonensis]
MFALDEALARWDLELPSLQGAARLARLAELAWHLRQRDVARARALGLEAAALMPPAPPGEDGPPLAARFALIEAEAQWLAGRLDQAQALAAQALLAFERQGDALGRADAHWLQAWIATDRGDSAVSDGELAIASADARAGGDLVRADVIDAAAALFCVFRNLQEANARWGQRFGDVADAHPAVAGWVADYHGVSAFQAADFGRAVGQLMLAFEAAMATGQLRRAINIATNIGNGFTSLNAHDAALEWMQRALALARPTGWPMSVGLCLMQTSETLRHLGQREAAKELLAEALRTLEPLSGSRAYAVALEYQGDLCLDLGDAAGALRSFTLLRERGEQLGQSDFKSGARRGQAHALSQQDRAEEALAAALSALRLARDVDDVYNQIAALRVLAQIHSRHALPAPPDMAAPNPVLHYLQQAMTVAATLDGYPVPAALLDAAAREYAATGDHARAYAIALQACAVRDQTHSQEATNRAIAMQVQYQTERAQTEGEHHRQLAAAEAERAEVLQSTNATLAHLSAIGQEITAHLDAAAVFRALDRHVHGLLDATHFSIFLLEPDGGTLRCAFGVEAGFMLPATRFALDDPKANSSRCVRERREIMIELEEDGDTPALIPGTLQTLSLLFAPLRVGERVLGAMTVQSLHAHAYGERELLIFRTLCAYGAIALDNASAYRQVAATQAQLLEKNVELERAYKALEEVSLTDQLTGLRNRRFFLQHVDGDVAMALRRYDYPMLQDADRDACTDKDLVFFMVDLDHFKEVNDRYGHAAGDAVLVQVQERLREVFRESDHLIRWGGEEFLVLARATDREEAKVVAERVRRAVANRDFQLPDGTTLSKTCSIGFACFPFLPLQPRLLSWSQVVELADLGLYIAKHSGRNAWAALYGTETTRAEGLFQRMTQQLERTVAGGEVRVVTNLVHPPMLRGERRRVGLSSDLA